MIEAKDSVDRLYSLVEKHYQEMSWRLQALEKSDLKDVSGDQCPDDNTIFTRTIDNDPGLRPPSRTCELNNHSSLLQPNFTEDLKTSRVYGRLPNWRSSMPSVCTGARSTSWSMLSGLSLADVSNVSVISLLVTTDELYEPAQRSPKQSTDTSRTEEHTQSTNGDRPFLPSASKGNTYNGISQSRSHVSTHLGKSLEDELSKQDPWQYRSSSSTTSSVSRRSSASVKFLVESARAEGRPLSPEELALWWSLTLNTRIDVLSIQNEDPGGRTYYLSSACGVDNCTFSLNRESRSLQYEFCRFRGNFSQRKSKEVFQEESSDFNPWLRDELHVVFFKPTRGMMYHPRIILEFSSYRINIGMQTLLDSKGVQQWLPSKSNAFACHEYICQIQHNSTLVGDLECVLTLRNAGHSLGNESHLWEAGLVLQYFLTKWGWRRRVIQKSIQSTAKCDTMESVLSVPSFLLELG